MLWCTNERDRNFAWSWCENARLTDHELTEELVVLREEIGRQSQLSAVGLVGCSRVRAGRVRQTHLQIEKINFKSFTRYYGITNLVTTHAPLRRLAHVSVRVGSQTVWMRFVVVFLQIVSNSPWQVQPSSSLPSAQWASPSQRTQSGWQLPSHVNVFSEGHCKLMKKCHSPDSSNPTFLQFISSDLSSQCQIPSQRCSTGIHLSFLLRAHLNEFSNWN